MSEQKIIIGDSLEILESFDDESVDMVITSPPYWNLRDYNSPMTEWKDGKECQLGLELTIEEYISHLIEIFDEVKRVLKSSGSCWVNIGDTYKNKMLCQIPSRFAIAMSNKGWILRNEVIWHKPNAMPCSVSDRFTVDFEKVFFFTKSDKYYFNQIKEPVAESSVNRAKYGFKSKKFNAGRGIEIDVMGERFIKKDGRNCRCVWTIPTSNSKLIHSAMFPMNLVERPIKACCPIGGTVLDPFAGSGTVLAYCHIHDISCIGIEINPEYEQIIKTKMEEMI